MHFNILCTAFLNKQEPASSTTQVADFPKFIANWGFLFPTKINALLQFLNVGESQTSTLILDIFTKNDPCFAVFNFH